MATINFKGENLIMERIEKRTLDLAWYMIENQATVRDLARVFSMSKSTVHNYLTTKLPDISGPMAQAVRRCTCFQLERAEHPWRKCHQREISHYERI